MSNLALKNIPLHIIGVFGVVLHVLLLIAFIKDPLKCFRNSATYLVANLAVSDLIISLCGPIYISFTHLGLASTYGTALGVSLPAIASIAADRYLMVTYPFKHHYLMSGKKIIIWITYIWILAAFRAVTQAVIWPWNVYSFTIDIYLGVAIVLLTGILFVLISMSLKKQARNLALDDASGSNRGQATRMLKGKQFVRTILLISCVAFIGIVPYSIAYYVLRRRGMLDKETLALDIFMCFLTALFFLTFASNPLIYFLRLPKYRKSFYLLYWRRHSNWE